MRNKLPVVFVFLLCLLLVQGRSKTQADQNGSADVNANVNNPSLPITPSATPIFLSPTPTLTSTPTPTSGRLSPTPTPKSPSPTPIPGTENDIYLDISGFASPNASIVMTSGTTFIRSVVAEATGDFFISQIKVQKGFSQFCLEAVDFKRIGDSITCFEIPPVTESTSKTNIFLPPSLGLSSRKTTPHSSVYGFGYTMPASLVDLHVSEGLELKGLADKGGFYKLEIKNLPVGTYELFATANYQKKDSEKPSKTQELKSLSGVGVAQNNLVNFLKKLFTSIWGFILHYGWIVLPILILIIILLSKKIRDALKNYFKIDKNDDSPAAGKGPEHLHHYYFIGY